MASVLNADLQTHLPRRIPSPPMTLKTPPVFHQYSETSFPSTMDLISSQNPVYWTKLLDLSSQLSPAVTQYNTENPDKAIFLVAKAEFNNPGMSHKDRIAKRMLETAVERKELETGQTVIAASSGNTGASIALIGQLMGFSTVIITDDKCSKEKKAAIQSYGAELWVLSSGFELEGNINKLMIDENNPISVSLRKRLHELARHEKQKNSAYKCDYMKVENYAKELDPKNYFSVRQYGNNDNLVAHLESTGEEIFKQTGGRVTRFVMSASTGGTIMGVGKGLKKSKSSVKVTLADPKFSRLNAYFQARINPAFDFDAEIQTLTTDHAGRKSQLKPGHERVDVMVEGAGKGSPTGVMVDLESKVVLSSVDDVVVIEDIDAFAQCRKLADDMGFLTGGSSGLNIAAATEIADKIMTDRLANPTTNEQEEVIVTILCDHGIKYLSKFYDDSWLEANFTEEELQSNPWFAKKLGKLA